jgi:hypothetical protein
LQTLFVSYDYEGFSSRRRVGDTYDGICFAGKFEDIGILDCGFFCGIEEGFIFGIGPAAITFVVIGCEDILWLR